MSENPYQSPSHGTPEETAQTGLVYYQAVSTKLTFAEYRRVSKNLIDFLLGVTAKLLRIRLPLSFAFADASHFQRVDPSQLSEEAREKIEPLVRDAIALGMHYALSYALPTVGTIEGVAAALRSEDGRVLMTIVYARTWTNVSVDEKTIYAFMTRLTDGRTLITSGSKPELDTPPSYLAETLPGRSMRDVFQRHQQRLGETAASPIVVRTPVDLEQTLREYEQENFTFQVERGVYVPLDAITVERFLRAAATTKPPRRNPAFAAYQGIEFVCWIVLAAGIFLFASGKPVAAGQVALRTTLTTVGIVGIVAVWLLRLIKSRKGER